MRCARLIAAFPFDNAVYSQPKRCHYRGTSLDEMLPALSIPRLLTSAFTSSGGSGTRIHTRIHIHSCSRNGSHSGLGCCMCR